MGKVLFKELRISKLIAFSSRKVPQSDKLPGKKYRLVFKKTAAIK
jgi:hypothetical protein